MFLFQLCFLLLFISFSQISTSSGKNWKIFVLSKHHLPFFLISISSKIGGTQKSTFSKCQQKIFHFLLFATRLKTFNIWMVQRWSFVVFKSVSDWHVRWCVRPYNRTRQHGRCWELFLFRSKSSWIRFSAYISLSERFACLLWDLIEHFSLLCSPSICGALLVANLKGSACSCGPQSIKKQTKQILIPKTGHFVHLTCFALLLFEQNEFVFVVIHFITLLLP